MVNGTYIWTDPSGMVRIGKAGVAVASQAEEWVGRVMFLPL